MTDLPPPPPPPTGWEPPSAPIPPPPPPPPGETSWPISGFPPAPPSSRRPSRSVVTIVVVATLAVLALAIAAVATMIDSGPSHPKQWDARVLDLVDYVEHERGLDFEHPVYVDFLSAEEYKEAATTEESELEDEDREELDRYAGELRALGVASGELDLFEAFNQVSDAGTLAYYDPIEERVRVRGKDMSVGLQVTLVHELTHALQDQSFDLSRLYDDDLEDSEAFAFRALVEGDASRVEDAYVAEQLSEEDAASYETESQRQLDEAEAGTDAVPAFISATFTVPYVLGTPLVQMLMNKGGLQRLDDAFEDPPATEEHLFDPASYLADEESSKVDLGLDDDLETFDDGTFGAPTWYLVLAERIDPLVAFDAALGWDGDSYAAFERDRATCVRTVFAGDTADDESEMAAALDQWVAAMPDGVGEVVDVDGHPGLEACDPGPDVDLHLTERSLDALYVPNLWGYLVADAATAVDAAKARCYAHEVIGQLTFEEITDPDGTVFQGAGFQQTLQDAFQTCA